MRVLAVVLLAVMSAAAQTEPEFEAAVIRHAMGGPPLLLGGPRTADPARINYQNLTLRMLLGKAYQVESDQIVGPTWIDSEQFTITAKIPAGATQQQFQIMLQRFLTARFDLKLHREWKEFNVYALTVAVGGAKLTKSDAEGCPVLPPGVHAKSDRFPGTGDGCSTYVCYTLPELAASLTPWLAPETGGILGGNVVHVVDRTALPGEYDFNMRFHPGSTSEATGTPLSAALERQLGLSLRKMRTSLPIVVIDKGDRTATSGN